MEYMQGLVRERMGCGVEKRESGEDTTVFGAAQHQRKQVRRPAPFPIPRDEDTLCAPLAYESEPVKDRASLLLGEFANNQ